MTKLTYFNVTGKAEAIRIAFSIAKINFEDKRLSHQEFAEIKSTLPNQQLPILEIDEQVYCQSASIFRYASKLAGLYPTDPIEALRVDMLSDQLEETFSFLIGTMKSNNKVQERIELLEKGGKMYDRVKTIDKWIQGPFYNGKKLSGADIQLFCFVNFMESGFFDGVPTNYFDQFDNIRNLHEQVTNSNEIISYYSMV